MVKLTHIGMDKLRMFLYDIYKNRCNYNWDIELSHWRTRFEKAIENGNIQCIVVDKNNEYIYTGSGYEIPYSDERFSVINWYFPQDYYKIITESDKL